MDIDLSVLRQMEREKEIPFEELVQHHRAGDSDRLPQAHPPG